MTTDKASALTQEVCAMIGVATSRVAVGAWGIARDDLRRFTQAIMDRDPRYWDEDFARTTKFGGIVTPPVYCSYLAKRTPAGADDPVTRAFKSDPDSDGLRDMLHTFPGALPALPTSPKRILNAGNEIEVFKYPTLGDRIFVQAKYLEISERGTKDGASMLLVTTEEIYTDQNEAVLCTLKFSLIYR